MDWSGSEPPQCISWTWLLNSEKRHNRGEALGRLIEFDGLERAVWPVEDLRRMFRLQLGAKLHLELSRSGLCERTAVLALLHSASPAVRNFADLLHHPRPPVELLQAAKDYAKACRENPRSHVPPEIATAMYYASIAAGMVRRGERITTLTDADLRQGLNWTFQQCWLEARTRGLAGEALNHLRLGRQCWRKA